MAKLVLTLLADDKAKATVQALNKEVQVLSKTLSSITVNKDLTAQINALTKHYTALVKAQEKVISNNNKQAISDEKLSQQQAITAKKVAEAAAAQARLEKAQQKTTATTEQLQKKFANLLSTIKSLKSSYPQGTFAEMEQEVRKNLQATKDGTKSVEDLGAAYDTLSTKVAVAKAETDKVTTAVVKSGDSIASLAKKFLLWQVTATLVMKPLRFIQDGLSSVNETLVKTEDAVIALQRVLPNGSATDDEISNRLYGIAQRYGQTFENVSELAQNFARTGMDWADTIKATEAAVLALNVAELDATEASEGLISILTQFEMTADQLTEVVDKLNKAADKNPVTTEKLLTALQRTGAAAKNANITLDETIGIITTLSKATNRSGENLGTAVNSLIQFSSKESSLDTFAKFGGDVEVAVEKFRAGAGSILEIWEELGKVIQNRQGEAESILGGGLFNNEEWTQLNDELKEALGESYADVTEIYNTASVFRRNYFVALLNDMDNVKKVTGEIADANGYSQSENEKYLNTYTARVNSLNAQWEELANNEQGWLSFKKGLVNAGSDLLKLIKYTGGLSTALSAAGTAVFAIFGPTIIAKLEKFSLSLQSAEGSALNLRTRLGNLANAELNLSFAQDAERVAQEALNAARASGIGVIEAEANAEKAAAAVAEASAAKAKASAAAWTSALTWVMLVLTVASSIDSTIRNAIEKNAEAERKAREEQDAAIAKANEAIEAQKQEVQSIEDLAASVENLRNVLDSSTASEEEKRSAQEKLLQIQNTLIESNDAYADSLNLTNGNLKEQLGLIEQLTTEQLKQKAQEWLDSNKSEIAIANSRLNDTSTTNTDWLFSESGYLNAGKFSDILNKAISGAGVASTASVNEDTTYTVWDNYGKRVGEGFNNGFWEGLGELTGFPAVFDKTSYVGEANAGFSFSGTTEQKLATIDKLITYISTHRDELGLTDEQIISFTTELQNQYDLLNSEEYQQAQRTHEIEQATNDWLAGTITEAEYLEKVYGITKATAGETGEWHNNIAKVADKYDDLISALEKLRDIEKESLELEERKKDVLEAQKALANAQHEATVRRYNDDTKQWEWQTDEKAIAEAEENLEEARRDLEEQAYDSIIKILNDKTATNDGLNALLDGLKDFLSEDFINGIKAAISGSTNVDLDKPVVEEEAPAESSSSTPSTSESPEESQTPELDNHGIQILKNSDGSYATGKGINKSKTGDNGEVTWNGKTYKIENGGENTDQELANFVSELGLPDRTIFTYKGGIYGVLDGGIVKLQARAHSYGDKSDSGYKALSDAATSEFGSYDNGGAAFGKGLMAKATNETETVNNPELTAKILSPVSNAEFHRWVRDQGILFETARQYAHAPVVERVGGNTDNSVNNSGQIIMNGVAIGSDQRGTPIDNILALAGIIPKV